jgi:S-adenosylmethionine uptake transporter
MVRFPPANLRTPPVPDASANYRGIRCLLIATTCLALNDACNKQLVASLPAWEIVLFRALITAGIILPVIVWRRELKDLRALLQPHIALRSLAESWIGPFLIIALAFMHQADATAIYMVAPVFVALVGFGHFKEKFSWPILLAVLIALAGAWLFVNPGTGVFQFVALLPLAAALCQTLREYISRTMGKRAEGGVAVSNRVILFSTTVFSLIAAAVLAVFFPWVTPVSVWKAPDGNEFLLLAAASALFYLGVTYTYEAYRNSDLSVVAPFRYWYLIVAIGTGFFAFGEIPGLQSVVGMGIIVGAGLLVLWVQQAMRARAKKPAAR